VKVQHRGLTFSGAYFVQESQKFGITPVLAYNGINDREGGFADISWQREIVEGCDLSARLRYDWIDREMGIGHFPYDGFDGHADASTRMFAGGRLLGGDLQIDYQPSDRFSLLGGVVAEISETDPYPFRFDDDGSLHPYTAYTGSFDCTDLSFFTQALLQPSDRSSLVVGFRFNRNSDSGTSFAPRAGFVYEVVGGTFLKVLYGEAYRSPDFFEKHVATYDVLYGSEDLEAEKVRTFDLALDASLPHSVNLRVNGFWLTTRDLITRVPTDDPATMGDLAAIYVNGGGERIWGAELSLLSPAGKDATLFLNYSFRKGETQEDGEDLAAVANHTANAGLSWKGASWLLLSPNLQYVGSRAEVDSYLLANLTVVVPVNERLRFSLTGRNLTDEAYEYPEYIRGRIPGIPGGPGRSLFARATFRWGR